MTPNGIGRYAQERFGKLNCAELADLNSQSCHIHVEKSEASRNQRRENRKNYTKKNEKIDPRKSYFSSVFFFLVVCPPFCWEAPKMFVSRCLLSGKIHLSSSHYFLVVGPPCRWETQEKPVCRCFGGGKKWKKSTPKNEKIDPEKRKKSTPKWEHRPPALRQDLVELLVARFWSTLKIGILGCGVGVRNSSV